VVAAELEAPAAEASEALGAGKPSLALPQVGESSLETLEHQVECPGDIPDLITLVGS
jgi:hypothetical protein